MKKLFIVGALSILAGCAHVPAHDSPGKQLIELQLSLAQKEAKLAQLGALLNQQQAQLKEKDAQIESLKERLKQFGIF